MVSPNSKSLFDAAMRLPLNERLSLAENLLASVDEDEQQQVAAEWDAELQRRLRSIDDGTAVLLDGDEILRKLEAGECP
ncbi:MAG: addiction module protein [Phycisphaeraceae bacterium]